MPLSRREIPMPPSIIGHDGAATAGHDDQHLLPTITRFLPGRSNGGPPPFYVYDLIDFGLLTQETLLDDAEKHDMLSAALCNIYVFAPRDDDIEGRAILYRSKVPVLAFLLPTLFLSLYRKISRLDAPF